MSFELFKSIVDQSPNVQRAVLHGVGEPMLVKDLHKMVRYLKDRGVYVLFNTNGTVLNAKNGQAMIDAGLDELRVSLDAATASSYKAIRGKNYFDRILRNVKAFRELQEKGGHDRPVRLRLAHGPEGDGRRTAGLREGRGLDRGQGGLPPAPRVLRGGLDRHGAARPGPLREADQRGIRQDRGGDRARGRTRA